MGLTAMDTNVTSVTVSDVDALTVPAVMEMVVAPVVKVVTRPRDEAPFETVATLVAEDAQVTCSVRS